jgi:branched-chain amino acid transport system substrate-binding protein
MRFWAPFVAGLALALATTASAQPVRIGLVLTLTGPEASAGIQIRDGLKLGLKKLFAPGDAPLEAELLIADAQNDAAVAAAAIRRLVEKDPPPFIIGPFSPQLLTAAVKPVSDAGSILFSAGSGPTSLAGRQCNANTFVTLWQDEQPIEVLARHAEESGWRRVVIVTGEDTAGKEAAAVIKRQVRGEIVAEIRAAADKSDFSVEIDAIAALGAQAVILAIQGGGETTFIRQFSASAKTQAITLLSTTFPNLAPFASTPEVPRPILTGANWSIALDTPDSKVFVAEFEAEFGYLPGPKAVAGYDAALLIRAAVRRTKGNLTDRPALRAAIRQGEIRSPRGPFTFANNNFPIQDFYLVRHSAPVEGKPRAEVVRQVFSRYGDAYASECTLR